jgi:hypothetical protein
MRIDQEDADFRPIIITLEHRLEAKALFDLVDMLDSYISSENIELPPDGFTMHQKNLLITLSNANTDGAVKL